MKSEQTNNDNIRYVNEFFDFDSSIIASKLLDVADEARHARILKTVDYFFEYGASISDVELAKLLNEQGIKTSSSTVGRDLSSKVLKNAIGEERFNKIQEYRAKNKRVGNQKGGINSAKLNTAVKNQNGKFNGSVRKK